MIKLFSFNRAQSIIILTVTIIMCLAGAFLLVYVPMNQRMAEVQRYRQLQNIDRIIQEKINNSVEILNDILNAHINNSSAYDRATLDKYIASSATKDFIISRIESLSEIPSAKIDSVSTVILNKNTILVTLQKNNFKTSISYSFEQFFNSILTRETFNQYLVLKSGTKDVNVSERNSDIIYQTFDSGVIQIAQDSVRSSKNIFTEEEVRDITLAGTKYKFFTHQIRIDSDTVIGIAGLLNQEIYNYEKNKLPNGVILFLFTLTIAIILALPAIKLYQMGSQDRLTVSDGLLTFPVAALLLGIFVFVFLTYNTEFRPGQSASEHSIKNIADGMAKSFIQEINAAYTYLQDLDSLKLQNALLSDSVSREITHNAGIVSHNIGDIYKADHRFDKKNISQVFWLNDKGEEISNWTSRPQNRPPSNFSNRNYFSKLQSKKSYFLNNDLQKPYYIEQVLSRTTGHFTTILSKPGLSSKGENQVAAIALELECFDSPVLPVGFSFGIIDNQGTFLYHSNPQKVLSQNVFDEFSETESLRQALNANKITFFQTIYLSKEYRVAIRPLSGLPYHLVIFEDSGFKNLRDLNVFTFCMVMLAVFFLTACSQLLLVYLGNHKNTFFRKHYFDLSWIGPRVGLHQVYSNVIIFNLIQTVFLIIFKEYVPFIEFVFILISSATLFHLFLNYQYYTKYHSESDNKSSKKLRGFYMVTIFLGIINIVAWQVSNIYWLIAYEAIMLLAVKGFLVYQVQIFKKIGKLKKALNIENWDFSHSFSLMVMTVLILISGLPMVSIYPASYDFEVMSLGQYRHTEFFKDLVRKNTDPAKLKFNQIYRDGVWIRNLDFPLELPKQNIPDYEPASIKLLGIVRKTESSASPSFDKINEDSLGEDYYRGSMFADKTNTYRSLPNNRFIHIASFPLHYSLPNVIKGDKWDHGLIYWILFILGLVIFWQVLHRICRKLFALNLPSELAWKEIDDIILTNNTLNSRAFVIGAPGSGKLVKVLKLIEEKKIRDTNNLPLMGYDKDNLDKSDVLLIDMILIPNGDESISPGGNQIWANLKDSALSGKYSLIIITHFEYDIGNNVSNSIKLDLLELLLQKDESRVIVLSTVNPVMFLDSLNERQSTTVASQVVHHNLERWHVLLGHFKILVQSIETEKLLYSNSKTAWVRTIDAEMKNGHFQTELRKPIVDGLLPKFRDTIEGDSLAFKIGITSQYFYMYIWQSLTKEEKFILYDLAEDGLVNSFDDHTLGLLIGKGIVIVDDGVLRLFNQGFRNFILTAIGASEASKIREQIKDNGNWSKLKIPLVIIIIAVSLFLYISQKEAYLTIIKYLTILPIIITALVKVLSLFDTSVKLRSD